MTSQAEDVETDDVPPTPFIIVCGSSCFSAETFMLSIDKNIVNDKISSFTSAICLMFGSYFCFNIHYPVELRSTLEFLQSSVVKEVELLACLEFTKFIFLRGKRTFYGVFSKAHTYKGADIDQPNPASTPNRSLIPEDFNPQHKDFSPQEKNLTPQQKNVTPQELQYILDTRSPGNELLVQTERQTCLTRSDFLTLGLRREVEST
ncbi:hypothetical protein FQA47_014485, partial [Oryzias melastigma]